MIIPFLELFYSKNSLNLELDSFLSISTSIVGKIT